MAFVARSAETHNCIILPRESEVPGLPASYFVPEDGTEDSVFYEPARLVAHIDDDAIAALRQAYHELLPDEADVLDLMSSRYSHLPPHLTYRSVTGLGMNAEEMDANPQLTSAVVHNLNERPILPFGDGQFDAVVCAVSIQYLRRPVSVLREVCRVLRPGMPLVIAFSNRCFPTKAVPIWLYTDDVQHFDLVSAYIQLAGGFVNLRQFDASPANGGADPLYIVTARRGELE